MRLYFDTNIYNRLIDDAQSEAILATFEQGEHEIYLSTLNIIEIGATPDTQRRNALLRCANRLRRDNLPLDAPHNLLRRSLDRFLAGASDFNASITQENADILAVVQEPERFATQLQSAAAEWMAQQEAWYNPMHRAARTHLQQVIAELPREDAQRITADARSFIRYHCSRPEFIEYFFGDVFADLGYGDTLRGRATEILCSLSTWCLYFKAMAYGVYDRAIKAQSYGRDSNPGSIDVQQIIYLAFADCFATEDPQLLSVGRDIVDAFHPDKGVVSYDELLSDIGTQVVRVNS